MDDAYYAEAWERYERLRAERPDAFHNSDPRGIVILTDRDEVRAAEKTIARRLERDAFPAEWSRAGLFYEDPWIYLTRDVVRFPSGNFGTYHHIIMRGGQDGVVILPVIDDRILLIRHFRNGRRNWSLEVPRGAPASGMSIEGNARQEILEEVQGEIRRLEYLGKMENNNGMATEVMHVYFAELSQTGSANLSEGIEDLRRVTTADCAEMIRRSDITDSHTIVAYTLAQMNNLLP